MKKSPVHFVYGIVFICQVFGFLAAVRADNLPSDLKLLVGSSAPSKADIATKDVLQLNETMFELYDSAAKVFRQNILAQHPVILALFSGASGRFSLYRPGKEPLEGPPVPTAYQLVKSVDHSTMALTEVVGPFIDNPADQSWRSSLLAYRSRMQSALDGLNEAPLPGDWQDTNRRILQNNIAFMDDCLQKGVISYPALQQFSKIQGPLLKLNINWAATTQVNHWMGVVAEWKKMLGSDWDKTYAASNTIYVARQNNILYSVLVQFFGPEAINDRLILLETISFTEVDPENETVG